jgi:two-component system chemotaxis response regulator CheB
MTRHSSPSFRPRKAFSHALQRARVVPRTIQAIAIGGSAGSVEVLLQLMPALPQRLHACVFVVVHQPRTGPSLLDTSLAQRCALPVQEALDKQIPHAGHVYVAPPDYHLLIDHEPALALSVDDPVHYSRPSIDVLFESAADVYRHHLLAILLSGASSDGTQGVASTLACGGMAIVQTPASAAVPQMPLAALQRCPQARTMRPAQIATWLKTLA